MLKVNVGMSRKVSRDYNSTGFSVNLEGKICASLNDPESVIERIKEFYDLAEESLAQQIERYEGDSAIASREEPLSRPVPSPDTVVSHGHQNGNGRAPSSEGNRIRNVPATQPTPSANGTDHTFVPATNKQIQFLLNIGKREGMTKPQLENRIAGIIGRSSDLYELSKQEAGTVLDSFTGGSKTTSSRR
ncbi:MAG TPA: hypothetical protein VNQ76_07595 [Planctomicrobium sp.]|nr:hypothetical protein [Planctomicrobium sp.]